MKLSRSESALILSTVCPVWRAQSHRGRRSHPLGDPRPPLDAQRPPPHRLVSGIAVVHNGIIENYLELRERLPAQGHQFQSETDTEVLPHLIESYYQGDMEQAIREALAAGARLLRHRGGHAATTRIPSSPPARTARW